VDEDLRQPKSVKKAAVYFVAAAFFAAQRFLAASAIRWRPSGERILFFFAAFLAAGATAADFLGAATTFLGLPAAFFAVGAAPPLSNARACCNWAISQSILARMSEIAMYYSPDRYRQLVQPPWKLSHNATQGQPLASTYDTRLMGFLQTRGISGIL